MATHIPLVGVMPPGFRHPGRNRATDVDMWATAGFAAAPFRLCRGVAISFCQGPSRRLKPGLHGRGKRSNGSTVSAFLPRSFRGIIAPSALVHPVGTLEGVSHWKRSGPMLLHWLAAVAMMLLIGCVNIANLLLVRASGRRREIAIRQSLGRCARPAGTAVPDGKPAAIAGGWRGGRCRRRVESRLTALSGPSKLPRTAEIAIDFRVLLFAIAVTLITGLLFGVAPAVQTSDSALSAQLKELGRGTGRQPASESYQRRPGCGRVRPLPHADDWRRSAGAKLLEI